MRLKTFAASSSHMHLERQVYVHIFGRALSNELDMSRTTGLPWKIDARIPFGVKAASKVSPDTQVSTSKSLIEHSECNLI